MNEARDDADAVEAAATNVLNEYFPAGGILSMVVVENAKTKKAKASADDATPVEPNVINDVLPYGGGLSIGVVANTIINEA